MTEDRPSDHFEACLAQLVGAAVGSVSGAARPNPLRVRGGGLRLALLRRGPTTASPVSSSSVVPVAVGGVDASVFGEAGSHGHPVPGCRLTVRRAVYLLPAWVAIREGAVTAA